MPCSIMHTYKNVLRLSVGWHSDAFCPLRLKLSALPPAQQLCLSVCTAVDNSTAPLV